MESKIVVFASGRGSNFVNLVEKSGNLGYRVVALIVDNSESYAIEEAKRLGIPYYVVVRHINESRSDHEKKIIDYLQTIPFNYIVLAGYMRILSSEFVSRYKNRIINIHPSILPAFKGKDAIKDAFEYGVHVTGVTIHYVDEHVDSGKIISQDVVFIAEDDTLESLEKKVHALEHDMYPDVIYQLSGGHKA